MPDIPRRVWLALGVLFIAGYWWVGNAVVCPTGAWWLAPLRWVFVCP